MTIERNSGRSAILKGSRGFPKNPDPRPAAAALPGESPTEAAMATAQLGAVRRVLDAVRTCATDADAAADLRPLLDQQVSALPEKYRLPLVLCAVQGLGKAEAAERLGLPEGTVSSRLARAREMLRDRLARRGVVVPAAVLGGVLV